MSSDLKNAATTQNRDTYKVATIIEQTRMVAADYRDTTGHALPVTAELARFDAVDKLRLHKEEKVEGVDATLSDGEEKFLIKGRVIFKAGKARQKLGKLNFDGDWNFLLMVIYDAEYYPTAIYKIDRKIIEKELAQTPEDKRGSMTVAKYKVIGKEVWTIET